LHKSTSEADREKSGKEGNMAIAFGSSAGDCAKRTGKAFRTAVLPQQSSVP
jgi:hypothetical protein